MIARALTIIAAVVLPAAGCGQDMPSSGGSKPPGGKLSGTLFIYCAAGVKGAIAEAAKRFETEAGVKVEITYANSGQLLGQIETTRTGDVYIPGDIGFAEKAKEKRLLAGEPRQFCYFVPVIYVRKGNPKGIRDLSDLARPGLRLCLADESAAVGQLQSQIFRKNALDLEALRKNTVASPATVTDVALAVKLGAADAGIIWDALREFAPAEAEAVAIPIGKNVIGTVSACVLAGAKNPAAAAAFVGYLASEKGRALLRERQFTVDLPK